MLKKEIQYRLCRLLLANLQGDGLLGDDEVIKVDELLLEKIDPPFRSAETVGDKIGDGVKVHERQKNN